MTHLGLQKGRAIALLLSLLGLLGASAQAADARTIPASEQVAQAAPTAAAATAQRGPAATVERRIADLRKKLHLTPAQEPQFQAFADVMRANAQAMQALFEARGQHRDRTAAGMLHWYAQLTAAHADALNKLVPVFDTLYQSLSPAQKKAADAAFQPLRQERPRHKAG